MHSLYSLFKLRKGFKCILSANSRNIELYVGVGSGTSTFWKLYKILKLSSDLYLPFSLVFPLTLFNYMVHVIWTKPNTTNMKHISFVFQRTHFLLQVPF